MPWPRERFVKNSRRPFTYTSSGTVVEMTVYSVFHRFDRVQAGHGAHRGSGYFATLYRTVNTIHLYVGLFIQFCFHILTMIIHKFLSS